MKISKYILTCIVLICMTAQGATLSQLCLGKDHCDSALNWVGVCHNEGENSQQTHTDWDCSFDHEDGECIDIWIASVAGSIVTISDGKLYIDKPGILKSNDLSNPFYNVNFSKLTANLFPSFSNLTSLSIASTVLII